MRTCYYELLGIERSASSDDIKKGYRKQALLWHPDKNYHRIDEATEQFAQIQSAYDVLSDPQERAWYDGHRDAILRGDDNFERGDSTAGTTVDNLMKYFNSSEYRGYGDDEKGFYTIYRTLFSTLEYEEADAVANDPEDVDSYTSMPSFGNSRTPFADEDGYLGYGAYVRDFYNAWANFSSAKSFAWRDKWRLSEAPDRQIRRVMEKENKKARDTAKKEYNDTVRSLAAFIRKRDPRYKSHMESQQVKKEAAAAEAKARLQRNRAAMRVQAQAYEEPEWMRVAEPELELEDDLDEEDDVEDEFYCAACNKSFKSDGQWENHEKNKKHMRMVAELRERLLEEENDAQTDEEGGVEEEEEEKEEGEMGDGGERLVDEDVVAAATKNGSGAGSLVDEALEDEDEDEEQDEGTYTPTTAASRKKDKKLKKKKKKAPRWGFADDEEEDAGLAELVNQTANLSTVSTEDVAGKDKRDKKKKKKSKAKSFGLDGDDEEEREQVETVGIAANEETSGVAVKETSDVANGKTSGVAIKETSDVANEKTSGVANKKTSGVAIAENEVEEDEDDEGAGSKKLSAKAKREMRKERKKKKEEEATTVSELQCNVCNSDFQTRNQLFSHIKTTGHALAVPGASGARSSGKKR